MSDLSRQQLEQLFELVSKQEQAYESNKLSLYRPHKMQEAFHRSNKKIRAIVAGNRSGKSVAAAIEAIWLCLGIHPHRKHPVPCRIKMYGESYSALSESLIMKFEEWCPRAYLDMRKPFLKNQLGQTVGVNFHNGSMVRFGTYDQEEKKSESSNWHAVFFDEPPSRELYVANLRGLVDFGGIMCFTFTPLSEAWLYDEIYEPGLKGTKPHIEVFQCSTYDNPYLPKDAIDLFASEMTEAERAVRIEGKFAKLRGLVIDTYDPFLSDIEPFTLTSSHSIYEGIDPHSRKPHAVLWKAVDTDGFRFAVAELSFEGSMEDFGKAIAEIRRELTSDGATLISSIADSSLNQKDLMFKINQRDELIRSLRAEGERCLPQIAQKKDWLGPGINKLRDLFRPIYNKNLDKTLPTEYLFNGCVPKYKYELLHYQWPEDPLDGAKPIAKSNEYVDCSRYIESVAPSFQTPGQQSIIVRRDAGADGSSPYKRLTPDQRIETGAHIRRDARSRIYRPREDKRIIDMTETITHG